CLKTKQLICNELIQLYHIDNAVDFTEWVASEMQKSTNHIDDILKPNNKSQKYVNQI
ncbi:7487_t:CDS:1, partial [Racocetra fulgida]